MFLILNFEPNASLIYPNMHLLIFVKLFGFWVKWASNFHFQLCYRVANSVVEPYMLTR